MDSNGNTITDQTLIKDLPIQPSELLSIIPIKSLDNDKLLEALPLLDISTHGLADSSLTEADMQLKLTYILNSDKCTLGDLAKCAKKDGSPMIKKMLLQFAVSLASSRAPRSTSGTADSADIATLCHMFGSIGSTGGPQPPHSSPIKSSTEPTTSTTTPPSVTPGSIPSSTSTSASSAPPLMINWMQKMMQDQQNLTSIIATLSANMSLPQKTDSYAKTPNSEPPKFSSSKKNCLSLKRFYTNQFSRWLLENKLRSEDTFVYLHKIFEDKHDQDRAFALIQSHRGDGVEKVLQQLGQFFRLNDLEIYELKEKFYSFKINANSDLEKAFSDLYELQASIEADSFEEVSAIEAVKFQFQRMVSSVNSTDSSILRSIFTGSEWRKIKTLDTAIQMLRLILGKKTKETPKQVNNSVSAPKTTSNNDDMDCSAIGSSSRTKSKKRNKNKSTGSSNPSGGHSSATSDKSKKKKKFGFMDCPNPSCKARNVDFASFCQRCGQAFKKSPVSAIEFQASSSSSEHSAEADATLRETINNIESATQEDLAVSNEVFTLDLSRRKLPLIQLQIFNQSHSKHSKKYKSLADTGARLNYINFDTFEKIKSRYGLILHSDHLRHQTANGEPLNVMGYTILPELHVFDSFNNKIPVKNIQMRVVKGLGYQFIAGVSLMKSTCPDSAFLFFPNTYKILLNANLKNSGLTNADEVDRDTSDEIKVCEISSSDKIQEYTLEPDDILVGSIKPLTKSNIENLGTPEFPIFTSSSRSQHFKNKLRSLINRYSSVTTKKYTPFKIDPIKIAVKNPIPPGGRYIQLQPLQQAILKRKVDKMVSDGKLSYTSKPANGCLMLTQKNNGVDRNLDAAWRVVNDLVHANKHLEDEVYHLPPINHILQCCESFNLFCKVDIPDAYGCVPIEPEDEIIATVPGHPYNVVFNTLPQGLKPASAIFSRVLDKIFGSFEEMLKYLDDLLLKARSEEELLLILERFLKTCEEFSVRISLDKCRFGVETLEFLSYKISNGRIGISEAHRKAIESIDGKNISPDTLAGFLGYFSSYIDDKDLLHFLRQDSDWNNEKELALNKLKEKILNAPMRVLVNFKSELKIWVDASDTGMSTACFQVDSSGKHMEVVSFFCKNLAYDKSWANKNIYERELAALAVAVSKYEYLLRGSHKVTIHTDNKAVSQSSKSRAFAIRNLFDRLKFEFPNVTIKHCTSGENAVADILSRGHAKKVDEVDTMLPIPVCVMTRSMREKENSEAEPEANNDADKDTKKSGDPTDLETLIKKLVMFHIRGGHPSAERDFEVYRRAYRRQLPGLTLNHLRKVLSACSCPNPNRDKANFVPRFPSTNQELFLDFKEIGGSRCKINSSRKMYRLSILEPLSGALVSVPHAITTGASVVDSISVIMQLHGRVSCLRVDNAPQFVSGPLKIFADKNDISIKPSSPYNPPANLAERHHSSINRLINLSFPNYEEAGQDIFDFVISYNATPLDHGFSPYEVLKGHLPVECLPVEMTDDAERTKQQLTAQQIIDKVYDKRSEKIIDKLPTQEKPDNFVIGQRALWTIKLPTGGIKQFNVKIKNKNPSSLYCELEHSGRTIWIQKKNIKPYANTDLLDSISKP